MADLGSTLIKGRLSVTDSIAGKTVRSLTIGGKVFNNTEDVVIDSIDGLSIPGGSGSAGSTATINLGTAFTTFGNLTLSTNGTFTATTKSTTIRAVGGLVNSSQTSETVAHGGTFTIINSVNLAANGRLTGTTATITLPADKDTKNTAGSTQRNTAATHYLIFATSQASSGVTYSDSALNYNPNTNLLTVPSATIETLTAGTLNVNKINNRNVENLKVDDQTIELSSGGQALGYGGVFMRSAPTATSAYGLWISNTGTIRVGNGTVDLNGTITGTPGSQVAVIGAANTAASVNVATISGSSVQLSKFTIATSVPPGAVFTDTKYSAASGGYLTLSGTAFSHNTVTQNLAPTATACNPAHGGSFTFISGLTGESHGHITAATRTTVKLPAETAVSITDDTTPATASGRTFTYISGISASGHTITLTKTTQTTPDNDTKNTAGSGDSSSSAEQYVIFAASQSTAGVQTYSDTNLKYKPSTGTLKATKFTGAFGTANWSMSQSGNDLVFTFA